MIRNIVFKTRVSKQQSSLQSRNYGVCLLNSLGWGIVDGGFDTLTSSVHKFRMVSILTVDRFYRGRPFSDFHLFPSWTRTSCLIAQRRCSAQATSKTLRFYLESTRMRAPISCCMAHQVSAKIMKVSYPERTFQKVQMH